VKKPEPPKRPGPRRWRWSFPSNTKHKTADGGEIEIEKVRVSYLVKLPGGGSSGSRPSRSRRWSRASRPPPRKSRRPPPRWPPSPVNPLPTGGREAPGTSEG